VHVRLVGIIGVALMMTRAGPVSGQGSTPLEVGAVAPGFELIGATQDGMADTPVRLEDFAGKTVVLAFFYKARTKG